jgi:hypothetical protein
LQGSKHRDIPLVRDLGIVAACDGFELLDDIRRVGCLVGLPIHAFAPLNLKRTRVVSLRRYSFQTITTITKIDE